MGKLEEWKKFYKECVRVLKITKKPDKNEFRTVTKVTSLGILVIGAVGFIITILFRIFVK